MTFGEAIQLTKQGKLVQRVGWDNSFIFQRPADALNIDMIVNVVKSLPQSVKDYFRGVGMQEQNTFATKIVFTGYLCRKTENDMIENGYLVSQSDMLAEDWVEFKIEK